MRSANSTVSSKGPEAPVDDTVVRAASLRSTRRVPSLPEDVLTATGQRAGSSTSPSSPEPARTTERIEWTREWLLQHIGNGL